MGRPQVADYPIGGLVHQMGEQHRVRQWVTRRHFAGRPHFQFPRPHNPVRNGGTVIVGGIAARVIPSTTNPDRPRPGIANVRGASIDYCNHVRVQNELAVFLAHGWIDLGIRFQQYGFNARRLPLGHIFALVISFEGLDELVALPCRVDDGPRTVLNGGDAQSNQGSDLFWACANDVKRIEDSRADSCRIEAYPPLSKEPTSGRYTSDRQSGEHLHSTSSFPLDGSTY